MIASYSVMEETHMPLATQVTKEQFESLHETLKEHYTDRDGVYVLDTDVSTHPDVSKLQKALRAERENARSAQSELKKLLGQQNESTKDDDDDVKTGLAKFKAEQDKKMSEMAQERDALARQVRSLTIVERGTRAIVSEDGIPQILLPHLQQVADVDEKGRVFIRGDDGQPLLKKGFSSLDDYMTLEQYVSSLKDDKVWSLAFNANGARGSNVQTTATRTTSKRNGSLQLQNGSMVWVAD